ncbi:helix-turn-helix domain-containing protein [Actinomadura harenae]|uniref:XRE family transcriptional regulator n=1 Tax=Actinomadura harenae TaxID=2483351 RepID=A0A3M2LNF9_9ACTN|nr:helix-turn-helix transcriptional regulator [Actinomadura harenae]RMI38410.1 XRE family transcriptional regulator [Actinomadura harenae]
MSTLRPSDAAKKAFGVRLRDLRLDASLSGVALAKRCGWHKTKISKIEHGKQTPSEPDIRAWATACDAQGQIPELVAAHRDVEQMWLEYRRELRAGQKHIQLRSMALYEQTKLLRAYEALFIPGFLQTFEYSVAQFSIHAQLHGLPLEDVEQAARNRLARQRLLGTGTNAFSFVLEASALHNNIGGAEVMSGQFDRLLEISAMPYVSIGIIPLGHRRTLYPGEAFYLFDEQHVRQEFWTGLLRSSRPEDIAYFVRAFAALRAQAVHGEAAHAEIESARRRLRGT